MKRDDFYEFSAHPDPISAPKYKAPGTLARFGMSARRWFARYAEPARDIDEGDTVLYGANMTTVASLLGYGKKDARNRQIIYRKWAFMESDPIVSAALKLLVTSALGGHETSGDIVFIEKNSAVIEKNKSLAKVVDGISGRLLALFNNAAYQLAYTGAAFGDAYARIYYDKDGVADLYIDELVRPPLVQPFEQGSNTVGYAIYTGPRNFERLDSTRMARLKMPRVQWVPQFGVTEKSFRLHLAQDEEYKLPIMPSMAGGSLLYPAEEPYDNLYASILGLVGQRWIDSIDEQILSVNVESMTQEQRKDFLASIHAMLRRSKDLAEHAVKSGMPILERIRHILPVHNEKQMATLSPFNQSGRSSNISIEDVVFHARLLAGALGVDLSMIGFSDQLSGGLGEGGFFRTSAQAAESARVIRCALADFFTDVIDRHTLATHGIVFAPDQRPWKINFYGSISALEAEKQRTRADAMNAGMLLVQSMQQMKELGADEKIMTEFLAKSMMLDEDQAKLYATIVRQPPEPERGMGMAEGGEEGYGAMDSARPGFNEGDHPRDGEGKFSVRQDAGKRQGDAGKKVQGGTKNESARKSIKDALEKAKDKSYKGTHDIATTSGDAIKKASDAGVDIEGYTHVIHGDAIRHIYNSHGEGKETNKNQSAITEKDFMAIPDVLERPDKVTKHSDKKGTNYLEYEKKMSDGSVIYVDEIRVGKKRLATKTMWKRKPPVG